MQEKLILTDEAHFHFSNFVNSPKNFVTAVVIERESERDGNTKAVTIHGCKKMESHITQHFTSNQISPTMVSLRFCGLTSIDFFLWGFLKEIYYSSRVKTNHAIADIEEQWRHYEQSLKGWELWEPFDWYHFPYINAQFVLYINSIYGLRTSVYGTLALLGAKFFTLKHLPV